MLELILLFGYLPLMFLLVVQELKYRKLESVSQQLQFQLRILSREVQQLHLENLLLKDSERDLVEVREQLKFLTQQFESQRLQFESRWEFRD